MTENLNPTILECRLCLPDGGSAALPVVAALDAALADLAVSTSVDEPAEPGAAVTYTALFLNDDVDQDDIAARIAIIASQTGQALTPDLNILPPTDWLAVSYQAHPPLAIGRFVIYGSHDRPTLNPDIIGLEIEAATAFGTGQHGTTAGCLMALETLKDGGFIPRSCIDVGTGSGILALAAYALWGCPVLATDIDPEAIRVTQTHLQTNNIREAADAVTLRVADGAEDAVIRGGAPYDCVIANILAGPLRVMAADLTALVAPHTGRLILSGLLISQADDVLAAYAAQGCFPVRHTHHGDWSTLTLQRR